MTKDESTGTPKEIKRLTQFLNRRADTTGGAEKRKPLPRLGITEGTPLADGERRYKIGLALGGGGARGAAHIGVLKVLEEARIPIDILAGTSMGGIVAAPYAAGFSARQIADEAHRLSAPTNLFKLVDWIPTTKGILQGQAVYDYLAEQLGEDLTFAELYRKLALTAVDLKTGQEVILDSGPVIDAVRATMAIPGMISPVEWEGHKLVDGGILNNVPADLARRMGADIVIAVDVSVGRLITDPDSGLNAEQAIRSAVLPSFALDMWRAQAIMMQEIVRYKLQASPPDVLISPKVPPDVTTFSFNRVSELIDLGETAARKALPRIMEALEDQV
jgi:NTE family protein